MDDDRGEELLHEIVTARGGFGHREHLELAWNYLAANDGLLDRGLLQRHYSPDVLWSDRARAGWVAPDLRPLPSHA